MRNRSLVGSTSRPARAVAALLLTTTLVGLSPASHCPVTPSIPDRAISADVVPGHGGHAQPYHQAQTLPAPPHSEHHHSSDGDAPECSMVISCGTVALTGTETVSTDVPRLRLERTFLLASAYDDPTLISRTRPPRT